LIEIKINEAGYEEGQAVIRDIQFSIASGEMIGLIGGNGAGKSKTIQTLLGTIPYSKSTVSKQKCGYVPERPILYTYYTLREHI